MFRMFVFAVLLMALSTTAAHGDETGPAAPGGRGNAGTVAAPELQAIDLRVTRALAWVQPSLRGALSESTAGGYGAVVGAPGRLQGSGRKGESATLGYTLSDRFSLDVGYDFLDVEDMVVRRGEPGTVDPGFTSHHLLLHARWRF